MLKKIQEKLAARRLAKLLDRGFHDLPPEMKEVVETIQAKRPKEANKSFQMALRDKLLLQHRDLYSAEHHEAKSHHHVIKKAHWQGLRFNWNWKKIGLRAALACLVLIIGTIAAYPLIPPPSVMGAERPEGIVEISSNAPFKVIFTQPMDRQSVEQAFQIEPEIEGSFAWDSNVLMFYPDERLPLGKTFKLTISEEAKSLFQKNLSKAFTENYRIVAPPKVILVTPAQGSIVDSDARITVMFDRPMKALSTLDSDQEKELKFHIVPEVPGRIKWLGTKSFQFIPERLPLATDFLVKIEAGISSAEGGKMEEAYMTTFTTLPPNLLSVTPERASKISGPETVIKMEFNQKMNLRAARKKIHLYKFISSDVDAYKDLYTVQYYSGEVVTRPYSSETGYKIYQKRQTESSRLAVETEAGEAKLRNLITNSRLFAEIDTEIMYLSEYAPEKETNKDIPVETLQKTLVVKPQKKLDFSSRYLIYQEENLPAAEGTIKIQTSQMSYFNTVGKPVISSYFPGDFDKNYREYYIRANFSNPMDLESIKSKIRVNPAPKEKNQEIYLNNNDTELMYYFEYQPSTNYTITLPAGLTDRYGQVTEKDYVISFKTRKAPNDFVVLAQGDLSIVNANFAPIFYIKSVNLNKVKLRFKALDISEFEYIYREGYLPYDVLPNEPFSKVWEKELKVQKDQKVLSKIDFNEETQSLLRPGFYFFEMSSPDAEYYDGRKYEKTVRHYFLLTNSALTYKQHRDHVTIWVTDIKTGQPINDIDLFVKFRDQLVADGRPNNQGIFEAKIKDSKYESYRPHYYVFGKRADGDITFVDNNWEDGINSWQFNIPYDYAPPAHLAYLYTDRPIYRPDQTVYFKGIVRNRDEGLLKLPQKPEIEIVINDEEYKEVSRQKIAISKSGTFHGELKLSSAASLGQYNIEARFVEVDGQIAENFYTNFLVAEYRRPDFQLELTANKKEYVNGEQAAIAIQGSYFFGAPLANAKISYGITATEYYFDKYQKEYYSFSPSDDFCYFGCSGQSQFKTEGKTLLDANGNGQITIPLEIHDQKVSQIYTIEVTASDLNNQTVSNRVTLAIHKGEHYVGIRSESYVAEVGKPFNIQMISVDTSGKELPNKKFQVQIFKRNWNTIRKQNVDGSYYYENSYDDKLIDTKSGRTSEVGKAEIGFTPTEGGNYRALVTSTDERGNEISAATSFYVASYDFINFGRENNDRIELIADKPEYQLGDIAKILVKSPYQKVKALLTIERGKILEKKVIDIESNSQILEIPIKEEYLPNVYISLIMVKGSGEDLLYKKSRLETLIQKKSTLISEKQNRLNEIQTEIQRNFETIEDEAKRTHADTPLQAEKAQIEKEIADLSTENAKAQGELSALPQSKPKTESQDSQIAAFKVGYAKLLIDTKKKNLTIDLNTDKKRYQPGEEVTVKIKTKDFNSQPKKSEISLSVVDASVLSLTEKVIYELVQTFYAEIPLGINNAQTLIRSLDRINVEAAKGSKGGGGGLGPRLRGKFKDSAYWNAVVVTNDNGEAEAKFTLPDNLTSWQILAIGATDDTIVGSQKTEFTVAKDIMIRPVLPRFLIKDDKATFAAIVHNQTAEPLNSQIFIDVKGIELSENQLQPINVPAGTQAKIEWHGTVKGSKEAKFKFLVEQGTKGDQVEITLPIYPFSFPEVVATSGFIKESKGQIEEIKLPSNIDPDLGELKVTIAPTLAASIAKGIEYLVQYPYGCAEQTASSLLPNLVVKQIIDFPAFSNEFIKLDDLNKKVAQGLQRLYNYQNPNGGFGLWENSATNPYTSAYVLFTIHQAQKAGYTIDQQIFEKGKNYLAEHLATHPLNNQPHTANERAFILFVLSEIDNGDLGLTNNLYDAKAQLGLGSKAYLAMTFDNIIKKQKLEGAIKTNTYAKINTLTNEIQKEQKVGPRGVHFEENTLNFRLFDSNTRTTALVLQMYARLEPGNPLVEKILRHLLMERKDGAWQTTQETTTGLMALIDFLKQSKELEPSFWGAIELNNTRETEAYFSRDTLADKASIEKALPELLRDNQTNQIKIVHGDGSGNLYYDINMQYFLPVQTIAPRDEGLQVIAEYFNLNDTKELNPLPKLQVGENYKGKITLLVPDDRYYMVVEDFIPAGLEGIDFNLKTSAQMILTRNQTSDAKSLSQYEYYYLPDNPFIHTEVRDDRVVFFADYLPKGVYEIEYFLRATAAGKYHDKPANAFEMYFPEVFGRSEGKILEIGE